MKGRSHRMCDGARRSPPTSAVPETLFDHNPVHDRITDLLSHADELEPSVAIGEHIAVMLYHEAGTFGDV